MYWDITKSVIIDFAQKLEEEGVKMTLNSGKKVTFWGSIHSILGDHMGQSALAGIGGPKSFYSSVWVSFSFVNLYIMMDNNIQILLLQKRYISHRDLL